MSFSNETHEKINQFAKEQAQHYLNASEMTYMEKLRKKAGGTKKKIEMKLSRFKNNSDYSKELQNDMVLFMNDYMEDLILKGLTEEQALVKAKEDLVVSQENDFYTNFQTHIQEYYESYNQRDYEAIGLFYGGFLFLGITIGTLIGYIISGGKIEFQNGGWIDTLVGTGVGALLGISSGLISHAFIAIKKK